jgi:hypothetical protein
MLPDLEGMLHPAASRFAHPHVARGVVLHHATDAAFHEGPAFLEHQAAARVQLSQSAVRRGPRRAVAHVGVELILDAALRTPQRMEVYVGALEAGLRRATMKGVPFLRSLQLRTLFRTLIQRAQFVTPRDPSGVVERLERALWARPALRLDAAELPVVLEWAQAAWQPIHDASQQWLDHLTQAVGSSLPPPDLTGDVSDPPK